MAKPAIDLSKLTVEEKLEMLDDLWESLAADDWEVSRELRAELDRRLDELDREGPVGTDWEDVYAEMTAGEP